MADHKWTEAEMNQTIDLHLAYQTTKAGRDQEVKKLAQHLNLSFEQVEWAVNAVGSLDPMDPRRHPRPSNALARLWKLRGFDNKLE